MADDDQAADLGDTFTVQPVTGEIRGPSAPRAAESQLRPVSTY